MSERQMRAFLWDAKGSYFCKQCGHQVVISSDHTNPKCIERFKEIEKSLRRRGMIPSKHNER